MMATISTTSTTSPASKRPKLSLQTSKVSSLHAGQKSRTTPNLSLVTQTPTYSNTCTNALIHPSVGSRSNPSNQKHSPQSSPEDHSSPGSSNSSATTSTSCHTSPFPSSIPYSLPLGPRSILRNSPLPRKLVSATSTRTPKLLFPRPKRVCFREDLEDLIPTSIVDKTAAASELSSSAASDTRLEDEIAERKALDELLEEGATTSHVCGRRKRRRDWIWRPLEEDAPRRCNVSDVVSSSSHRPIPELKRETTLSKQHACENFGKATVDNEPSQNHHDSEALKMPQSMAADPHVATTQQQNASKGV